MTPLRTPVTQAKHDEVWDKMEALIRRGQHWEPHPAVRSGRDLSMGERAADAMKRWIATWTAITLTGAGILGWLATGGMGTDPAPFLGLNLTLSCFAALQCFILLIAAKRADQIDAEIAMHTLENTQLIQDLIKQNTGLTQEVHDLVAELHPKAKS